VVQALGQPLDLLGMDACLMSNLEVAYQARSYVKYIVASEENEPNDGWPYDRVLRTLAEQPDTPTAELAARIVHQYVASYVERNHPGDVTQAALDLAQVDLLTEQLDGLGEVLIPRMGQAKFELGEALYATSARFWDGTLWDLAELCAELIAQSGMPHKAARAVQASFNRRTAALLSRRAQRHQPLWWHHRLSAAAHPASSVPLHDDLTLPGASLAGDARPITAPTTGGPGPAGRRGCPHDCHPGEWMS
jgi:hypothetical protein